MYYKEAQDGQILEEGITEAGSMSSFIAAGTAYCHHGVNMIPFFIYYSMFGFQRIGDLIWAAMDSRAKGFLIGGTAGRTTLNGEGLQHQDGHSLLNAIAFPTVRAYDPAFAYETAVIIMDGLKRLYTDGETAIYYLTVENEAYAMPEMPAGAQKKGSSEACILSRGGCGREAPRASAGQRRHPEFDPGGPEAAGGQVRGVQQGLERDQLRPTVPRSA
jgi:pyruvate dehydrogenase E1 component